MRTAVRITKLPNGWSMSEYIAQALKNNSQVNTVVRVSLTSKLIFLRRLELIVL